MKTLLSLTLLFSGCCDTGKAIGDFAADKCIEIPDPNPGEITAFEDSSSESGSIETTGVDPTDGDCCEAHGVINGGTCLASEFPFCINCEGESVLCMTHGCATQDVEDCCLSDEGETIACTSN